MISYDEYKSNIQPVHIKLNHYSKTMLVFTITIDDYLKFENGFYITQLYEDSTVISFKFNYLEEMFYSYIDGEREKSDTQKNRKTNITFICSFQNSFEEVINETYTYIFDKCIHEINLIIDSIRISKKEYVKTIAKENLSPVVLMAKVNSADWDKIEKYLFMVNFKVSNQNEKIYSVSEIGHIITTYSTYRVGTNPFLRTELWIVDAYKAIYEGCYSNAIIYAQTCVELFLNNVLRIIYENEGLRSDQIDDSFERNGFISRVRSQYSSRMKGQWNTSIIGSEINKWYTKCYFLRNKILHGNYSANINEATDAVSSARSYIRSVIENSISGSKYSELIGKYVQ